VLGQMLDPVGKQGDLAFGGTGIGIAGAVIAENIFLISGVKYICFPSLFGLFSSFFRPAKIQTSFYLYKYFE
jgi:hypothetical protein